MVEELIAQEPTVGPRRDVESLLERVLDATAHAPETRDEGKSTRPQSGKRAQTRQREAVNTLNESLRALGEALSVPAALRPLSALLGAAVCAVLGLLTWGRRPSERYGPRGPVGAVAGLEFYKSLYDCCTPPGYTDSYMQEGLDAFKSGQVAMMMNWFAFFPGLYKDPNVGGDKIGFFVNPSDKTKGSQLGGQGISVVAYSPNRNEALAYIKWFATLDVQKKWWALGGYSASKAVLEDPNFPKTAPFAADFLVAMGQVKDFWAEPSYATLMQSSQKWLHDYVVAGNGTAKEALDGLVADWHATFEEEGKY